MRISVSLQWRHMGGVKLAALDPKFNLTDEVSPAYTKLRAQDYFDVATVFKVRQGLRISAWRQQRAWIASRRSSSATPRRVMDRSTPIPIPNGMIRSAGTFSPA